MLKAWWLLVPSFVVAACSVEVPRAAGDADSTGESTGEVESAAVAGPKAAQKAGAEQQKKKAAPKNMRVIGTPGNDTIATGAGNDYVEPGAGADVVSTGAGDDVVRISDLCEIESGKIIDGGSGNDTLVLPAPAWGVAAMGLTWANFEVIVVDPSPCSSQCVKASAKCSGVGTCVEDTTAGAAAGKMVCQCPAGTQGTECQYRIGPPPPNCDVCNQKKKAQEETAAETPTP